VYVSSVSYVLEVCFICVFPDTCCKCIYLVVVYVSHIRCMCFFMLRMVAMVSSVFRCFFKCFNCLQTYVVTAVFRCFKSRSGVACLFLNFCCIVSVCPPPGTNRTSIRRCGRILPDRRRCAPPPLVAQAARVPAWSSQNGGR
jgi:hypothetical protein